MEHSFKRTAAAFLMLAVLLLNLNLNAQTPSTTNANLSGKDVPRIIGYQGKLMTTDGSSMNGTHHITVTLFSDHLGKTAVWADSYDAEIRDGIFSISLGSGVNKLPDNETMDRPLWLGIQVEGSNQMQPLTPLTAVPYAINIADKSITFDKLSPELQESMLSTGGKGATPQKVLWNCNGNNDDGTVCTNTVAGGDANIIYGVATHDYIDYSTISGGQGNKITSQFSTNPGLEGTNWHTISGGHTNAILIDINSASDTEEIVRGSSTIAGGEKDTLSGPWGFIGGGQLNYIGNERPMKDDDGGDKMENDVISGGKDNSIDSVSSNSSIEGGLHNHIAGSGAYGTDPVHFDISSRADNSFIGGGHSNMISSSSATIVGGENNLIAMNSDHSFVGGGKSNLDSSAFAVSGGGELNIITTNADHSFIGGGALNIITTNAHHSFIGGGKSDTVNVSLSSVVGGEANTIKTSSDHSFIGGGFSNSVNSKLSSITSGDTNRIDVLSDRSFIGGGTSNKIEASHDIIGGGEKNLIDLGASHSTIVGGDSNRITKRLNHTANMTQMSDSAVFSFIGGGYGNTLRAPYGVIAGGDSNLIDSNLFWGASYSAIGGGLKNVIDVESPYNVIAGGGYNYHDGYFSVIGGGSRDTVFDNCGWDAIGGGYANFIGNQAHSHINNKSIQYSVIGGGDTNTVAASFSGILCGQMNLIADNSASSAISGGDTNTINSPLSFIGTGCHHIIDLRSQWGVIGGGCTNYIFDTLCTIGGGAHNSVLAYSGFIGGGQQNLIDAVDGTTHSDGNESRYGTIAGGFRNNITKLPLTELHTSDYSRYHMPQYASIGGGLVNRAEGHFSTIPGGLQDSALGYASATLGGIGLKAYDFQAAVGLFNDNRTKHLSLTAFGDPTLFGPPVDDDAIFMVGSGTSPDARRTVFEVTSDGRSSVFKTNLSGGASGPGTTAARIGSTYRDNVIYGAGEVDGTGLALWDFGTLKVTKVVGKLGTYIVKLNTQDSAGNHIDLSHASIVVTVKNDDDTNVSAETCAFAMASTIGHPGASEFIVRIFRADGFCTKIDLPFMYIVTGRKDP